MNQWAGAVLALLWTVSLAVHGEESTGCGTAIGYFDDAGARAAWYEGSLSFRGATTPLRLKVVGTDSGLVAWLDLPALVYAWEPVTVTGTLKSFELELPFGVGRFGLHSDQENQAVSRKMGEDDLVLRLGKTANPGFSCQALDFNSGGVALAGSVILPEGSGPHPAIVLAHGAGPVSRQSWSYRSWADFHVRQGLAVLIYDKRGTGDSGGATHDADLTKLAADLEAGFEALQGMPETDAGRIGIRAHSQGGWLATLVAARNPAVAFLILGSPSALDPMAQEIAHIEYELRAAGFADDAINEAKRYLQLYETVVRSGQGWEELEIAAKAANRRPWGEFVDQPYEESHLDWYRTNAAIDPVPLWRGLEVSTLALYGAADLIVPPAVHAPLMEAAFAARPGQLELSVFHGADHRLEAPMGKSAEGSWRWFGMADGVLEVQRDWLGRKVLKVPNQ